MAAIQADDHGQADDQSEPDREADRRADAMKDQLRKDVASWSAARSDHASDTGGRASVPAVRQPAPRAARKAKPVEPPQPVLLEKKPFKMSYDGTTDRDYIAARIKLGAR